MGWSPLARRTRPVSDDCRPALEAGEPLLMATL